jgi:uncharacterized protein (DUF1501 family)
LAIYPPQYFLRHFKLLNFNDLGNFIFIINFQISVLNSYQNQFPILNYQFNKMASRRNFLKIVGTTTGGSLLLPKFLTAMPSADLQLNFANDRNIVVVVQLNGGNDGLNSFIPYDDPLYYQLRKNVAIPKDQVLKVAGGGMGWHPSLTGFADMQQAGHLSVVQNVGYPNPNRSHFRSIEIWQTGSASNEYLQKGWLGRYLDASCAGDDPLGALNIDNFDNLALRGAGSHALTMQDPKRFEQQLRALKEDHDDPMNENPNLDFVRKLMIGAFDGSDEIKKALEKTKNAPPQYPRHSLAQNLAWVGRMIKGGLPTSVYYTGLGGFDTHTGQLGRHKNLMNEVSESVKAFYDDIRAAGLLNNVTVLIFSEFGRRVKDNGSGTDHGTAAPVFVIGGKSSGKIIGANPNLSDLDNGDLKFQHDFRSVYATILKDRLGIEPTKAGIGQEILRGMF